MPDVAAAEHEADDEQASFASWVGRQVAAGRVPTTKDVAAYLGVSDSMARRRLAALKIDQPALFLTPPPPAEVPAQPAPTPAPAAVYEDEDEDEDDVEATRIRPRRSTAASVTVHTSTAGALELTGTGVLGRRPSGDGTAVMFPDSERTVSKTHLAFAVDRDGLTITDLHSGNGTQIHRSDQVFACTPGTQYRVLPGDRVEIGEEHFTLPA